MVQAIIQVFVVLSLVLGIVIGEAIAANIFGSNKKWYVNIAEMVLFITLIVLLMDRIYLPETDYLLITGINFFIGLTTLLASRSLTTGFGFVSKRIKKAYEGKGRITDETYIIGLARNLLNKKMPVQEVKRVLENSGFSRKKVNFIIKNSFPESSNQKSS